jgi:sugar/nucleoside kinase (ribokinase family)
MSHSREEVCAATTQKLRAAAPALASRKALIGLDGFVDEITAVVDKRYSEVAYDPVRTIAGLAEKIRNAAGESSNYELVVRQRKHGGNGPILANALASLGVDVTYIGNLGFPTIHPVFEELARHARVISIADAGHTDALEFDDGKIMLVKSASMKDVNWENLIARVGRERLTHLISEADIVGLVNWTTLPEMTRIWERLLAEVLPTLGPCRWTLFIDLADPEKRTPDDIREAMSLLTKFQERVDVTLGLNLKEAVEVAHVIGITRPPNPEAALEELTIAIRQALDLSCVVVHPRRSAAAATVGQCVRFDGPFIQHPLISTGAGDHFNAGFCIGRILGFTLEECLCAGVATSGYYVRNAISPTATALAEYIAELPPPQA